MDLPTTPIEIKLDTEINALLIKLRETTKDSEEYGTLVERIVKLHKLKTDEADTTIESITKMHKMAVERKRFKQISGDVVLGVAANILGILWLTRYEKEHVISSKALGFVVRPRV